MSRKHGLDNESCPSTREADPYPCNMSRLIRQCPYYEY